MIPLKETEQGAQVSGQQFDRIMKYIETGKKEARLVAGGVRKGNKGYFIEPTIFTDVKK
jgi:aldehyde dehydrogenase (NAD+)